MASISKNTLSVNPLAVEDRKRLEPFNPADVPRIKLNNQKEIPVIGLGARKLQTNCKELLGDAIKLGYRHFDCAEIDGNEKEIGEAIKEYIKKGLIHREDIFITTKLWNNHHSPQMVRKACETSLKNLGLKYLDAYVIESPMAFEDGDDFYPRDENGKIIFSKTEFTDTWLAMEKLVQKGIVLSIGLANFNVRQIIYLMENTNIKPAFLQIENHPYFNQQVVIDFCVANDIAVVTTHCFGSPGSIQELQNKIPLLVNPTIREIASKRNITPAQVLTRYQIQRGNIIIVAAVKKLHMRENIMSSNCSLDPQDMLDIDTMDMGIRLYVFDDCKGHPHHPYEKDLY